MTMKLVANRDGHKFYKGFDRDDRPIYSVIPSGVSSIPTGGFYNSYKACEVRGGVYNVFKLIEITK